MTAETDEPFDVMCDILGSPRRRHLLALLFETGCGTLEELGQKIAARERAESGAAVSEAAREAVLISLLHNHLPRLADHGVVEYDARSGDVVLADGGVDLEPYLDPSEWPSGAPSPAHDSPQSISGTDQEC